MGWRVGREREAQKETREEEEEKREREKEEKEEEKINAGKEGMRMGIRIIDALVGKESYTGEGVSAGQPVRERRRRGVEGGAVGTPEKKRKSPAMGAHNVSVFRKWAN